MKALIVIDTQEVIVNHRANDDVVDNIKAVIEKFRSTEDLIIFTQHLEDNPEGFFYKENENVKIIDGLVKDEYVLKKCTPSIFRGTDLENYLRDKDIDHITIIGFNTEYCCMFSAIAAYDRGFDVTMVEDACGTANDDATYEMPGLDISDFVSTVLDWSGVIEVVATEEL